MFKRFFSVITSMFLLMFCLMPNVVSAATFDEEIKNNSKVTIMNEYEYVKSVRAKSNVELKKKGMTNEDIGKLKNNSYEKEIERRSKLDSKELKLMGYSDEQIREFKNFNGSDAQLTALSSYARIYSGCYTADGGYNFTISYSWGWVGQPVYTYTDIVSCGWAAEKVGGGTGVVSIDKSRSYCQVLYYNAGIRESQYYDHSAGMDQNFTGGSEYGGVSFNIPMESIASYAMEGNGKIQLHANYQINELLVSFAYGHTSNQFTTPKPSISVSASGPSVSISFTNMGTSTEDTSSHRYNRWGTNLS